ncbi:hypothetical protein DY000_02060015 [Brassica cretica]|uniref:Uncharacterized protein n=1 Tax=Brassica cretica TaxID=69181 RepID=A0ABQ7AT07_BRACR|nr:hypothetical protein DY000_02060015 [Brassica cretica]
MLALEIFSLVVDIPVVMRVFPSRGCLLRVPCEPVGVGCGGSEPVGVGCGGSEPVGVGCGGSEPDSRPVLPALPNRGFLLPLPWAFRTTHPAERTGFAFFSDGRRHLRPSDRTGRLCPDRSARNRLLRCSRQEVEGSPRSVVRLAGLFRQGSDLKNPCLPVWPDSLESQNRVFYRCRLLWPRAGFYSWPSPLSITALVVTVDTFPAGVLSALALTEIPSCVCLSLSASIVIPD